MVNESKVTGKMARQLDRLICLLHTHICLSSLSHTHNKAANKFKRKHNSNYLNAWKAISYPDTSDTLQFVLNNNQTQIIIEICMHSAQIVTIIAIA